MCFHITYCSDTKPHAAVKVKDDELKTEKKIIFPQCGKNLKDPNEYKHLCDYFYVEKYPELCTCYERCKIN